MNKSFRFFFLIAISGLFSGFGAFAAPAPEKIHLNHFYVTIPDEDFAAVETSEFLQRGFGVYEKRTTRRNDLTYTGLYFYGKNTYFEFFRPADTTENPLGNPLPAPVGLAYGVDAAGDAQAIGTNLVRRAITRGYAPDGTSETQIPWFLQWNPANAAPSRAIALWSMEYEPAFLERWYPELGTPGGEGRAAVLARYKAKIARETGVDPEAMLFEDIVKVNFELPAAEIARFTEHAAAFGAEVVPPAEGDDITLVRTARQEFRVRPGPTGRILMVWFRLTREHPAQTLEIGSRLFLRFTGGREAFLLF